MNKKPHIPDQRSLAFHKKASEILLESPSRYQEVLKTLENWISQEGTQAQAWAQEWQSFLDGLTVEEVANLITLEDEKMDFYRKSSPFSCLLTEDQRLEIIKRIKYEDE